MVPTYYQGEFHIGAQRNTSIEHQGIALDATPVYDTGLYFFKRTYPYAETDYYDFLTNKEYDLIAKDSLLNWVHITKLDSTKLIVSGTFSMYLTAPGLDTIRITSGRFDAKYSY